MNKMSCMRCGLPSNILASVNNSDNEEALDALLQRNGTLTIHKKNLQKLMVEVYKTVSHLNPPYMCDLFTQEVVEHDFRLNIAKDAYKTCYIE